MKANFKKFPVYNSIRKDVVIERDIAFDLSNAIYTNIPGIAAHALAMKIYNAEGEVELTHEEAASIEKWSGMFVGLIADSIKDYFEKNEK